MTHMTRPRDRPPLTPLYPLKKRIHTTIPRLIEFAVQHQCRHVDSVEVRADIPGFERADHGEFGRAVHGEVDCVVGLEGGERVGYIWWKGEGIFVAGGGCVRCWGRGEDVVRFARSVDAAEVTFVEVEYGLYISVSSPSTNSIIHNPPTNKDQGQKQT
jgi:hypothetical protein